MTKEEEYNRNSLIIGLSGLVIQVIGYIADIYFLLILGSIMFIIGLVYYSLAKGRSGWWGLLGLLSLVGLIMGHMLPTSIIAAST